jgi:Rrf2 family protein
MMLDEQSQPIVMSAREAAKLQGVPYEYLAKIFTKLSKACLVESSEGRKGGFKLAKVPTEISILDITRAIDGEKSIFDCKEIRQRMDVFPMKSHSAFAIEVKQWFGDQRGICVDQ